MSLSIQTSIQGVIDILSERVSPAVDDHYVRETIRMAQSILRISVNALDDVVVLRVEENAALRALFAAAAGAVNANLAQVLADAARSIDPSLKISALDAENARLRAILVRLHAEVEVRTDETGQQLNKQIWHLLQAIETTRAPVG